MTNIDEKEIQKTLEEIKRRTEEFQTGKNYSSNSSSFDSFYNSNLKLILTIVGVVVLVASLLFYSTRMNKIAPIKSITTPDVLPK